MLAHFLAPASILTFRSHPGVTWGSLPAGIDRVLPYVCGTWITTLAAGVSKRAESTGRTAAVTVQAPPLPGRLAVWGMQAVAVAKRLVLPLKAASLSQRASQAPSGTRCAAATASTFPLDPAQPPQHLPAAASLHSTPQPPRRLNVLAAAKAAERPTRRQQQFVQVEPDGSDVWRLDPVVDALKGGSVGIIPTDSNLAFVCDLGSRSAVEKLLAIKGARGSQRMSILCRSLQDVDTYTLGWPPSRMPGQPDMFKLVKRMLPGPYTFILLASKELPKALTNVNKGKSKKRHEVGVRLPDDPVAQAILQQLDRPLLCSTAATPDADDRVTATDAAVLMDRYGPAGLDFVVDAGPRLAEGSSVIDCTGAEPVVVRQGKGDTSFLG